MRRGFALALALLAAGCAVGPDYEAPQAETPAEWQEPVPPGASAETDETALARWWTEFDDPGLTALVEAAVAGNRDLAASVARVREARALREVAGADELPEVDFIGDAERSKRSVNAFLSGVDPSGPGGPSAPTVQPEKRADLHTLGLDASWELDLFGGVRRGIEAADADLAAAREDQRAVLVSLLGEVGLSWIDARASLRRLAIARDSVRSQGETADLTRARRDAGMADDFDVARAEALVSSTLASIPALEERFARACHRLDVLTGRPPGAAGELLSGATMVPPPPARVPVGLPSDLLRRRPDVRRSERRLAAATARVGVATADLYPKFSLTGSVGQSSVDTGNLFDDDSEYWSIGLGLSWPLFNGGRLRAGIEVADARAEQALRLWESSVLVALQETHDALVAYGREQERRAALELSATAQRRAADLARQRQAAGLSDFLEVLDAERSLLSAEDLLALSEAALASNAVALYKALGGGWEPEPPAGAGGAGAAGEGGAGAAAAGAP